MTPHQDGTTGTKLLVALMEFGVPIGRHKELARSLEDDRSLLVERTRERSQCPGERLSGPTLKAISYRTFGPTDLLYLLFCDNMAPFAHFPHTTQSSYQRFTGAYYDPRDLLDNDGARLKLFVSPDELLRINDYTEHPTEILDRPVAAVCHLKLDPAINMMVGSSVRSVAFRKMPTFLNEYFRTTDDAILRQQPAIAAPYICGPLDKHVQVLPLRGMDETEIIMVIHTDRLEWVTRIIWALRSLTVADFVSNETDIAAGLQRYNSAMPTTAHEISSHDLETAPLFSYSTSTIGVPDALLAQHEAVPDDKLAAYSMLLLTRFRILPHSSIDLQPLFAKLEEQIGGSGQVNIPFPSFSLFGRTDLLYGAKRIDQGDVHSFGPSTVPLKAVVEYLRILSEPSPLVVEPWEPLFQSESDLAVLAFPPGHKVLERPRESRLQSKFAKVLYDAYALRVRGDSKNNAVSDIKKIHAAGREQGLSYAMVNGASNLVKEVWRFVADRYEIEDFLDLVRPIDKLREFIARRTRATAIDDYTKSLTRLFNMLERVSSYHARGDSPARFPAVSLPLENRMGHGCMRSVFNAYLAAVVRSRGITWPHLLVDGPNLSMEVRHSRGLGIFMVTALRCQHPYYWPAVVHEAEHLRLLWYLEWQEDTNLRQVVRNSVIPLLKIGEESVSKTVQGLLNQMKCHVELMAMLWGEPDAGVSLVYFTEACLEAICDISVLDSGAVGNPDDPGTLRRFWNVLGANLVLDLRERLSWMLGSLQDQFDPVVKEETHWFVFRFMVLDELISTPIDRRFNIRRVLNQVKGYADGRLDDGLVPFRQLLVDLQESSASRSFDKGKEWTSNIIKDACQQLNLRDNSHCATNDRSTWTQFAEAYIGVLLSIVHRSRLANTCQQDLETMQNVTNHIDKVNEMADLSGRPWLVPSAWTRSDDCSGDRSADVSASFSLLPDIVLEPRGGITGTNVRTASRYLTSTLDVMEGILPAVEIERAAGLRSFLCRLGDVAQ